MQDEGFELIHGPEAHLLGLLLAHATSKAGWAHREAVILRGIIQDRGELVVDCLDVGGRQFRRQKLRLPAPDVGRGDLIDGQVLEEWQHPVFDDVTLVLHRGGLEPVLHVREIELHQGGKGHVAGPGPLLQKLILKGFGLPAGGKSPLLFQLPLTLPVREVEGGVPGPPLFVFVGRNLYHPRDMFLNYKPKK